METTPKPTASIEPDRHEPGYWMVYTDWSGDLDRPRTFGIGAGKNRKLAERCARAINEGAVFSAPEVRTDVNGKTYVQAKCNVLARMLNADLKRLGY